MAEYLWKDGVGLTETVSVVAIDHYFCFVCLQKLMQDFLSANGKKDFDTTEALNVMDRLLYYLQNTYHI